MGPCMQHQRDNTTSRRLGKTNGGVDLLGPAPLTHKKKFLRENSPVSMADQYCMTLYTEGLGRPGQFVLVR